MSTIVTRAGKGSPLTHVEVDANFTNLNTDKVEKTSADITGGTINGTTIGATTPSSIVGTTITGQTGVLRGTGTNLVLYSQDYTQAQWTKTAVTTTASGATAPDSTTTAITVLETTANSAHAFFPTTGLTTSSGALYTISVYVKANGRNFCAVYEGSSGKGKFFNITAGGGGSVLGNLIAAPVSAALTYVGNDWYRASIVVTAGTVVSTAVYLSTDGTTFGYTGNASLGILAWGMQLEFGSTLNTYIPTTTTAVYGTPTLSFSGVSTLGLESNGALFLQPAGTGAIQAQATTSTTAGGNVRGANAVDWQTTRGSASQVASGSQSVIGGGINNSASGVISGVLSGGFSAASAQYAVVTGGVSNTSANYACGIVAGQANQASGYFNLIGGGFTNSGTSGSAVTTQATTTVTSGSTAVTLSASNASIKVGQLIAGTGIPFPTTYVAAISGTSLTLSANATATGTPTLSFFTPHGVVVGGGNNQATGSYSFIGGGGDAGTAANRNVASGDWSFVGGGQANTASGIGSFVGGGGTNGSGAFANTSSGVVSCVLGGLGNFATATGSTVLGGYNNTSNGTRASVLGGRYGTTRSINGNVSIPACDSPIAQATGVSQSAILVLAVQTTDATATALRSDTSAAGTTNQVILPNNSAYLFKATVISGVTVGGNTSGWKLEGVIKRGANAASTAIVGLVTTTLLAQDAGAATWAIAATADTTNGGLRITFTGQASTTIRTVCKVETTEMTY